MNAHAVLEKTSRRDRARGGRRARRRRPRRSPARTLIGVISLLVTVGALSVMAFLLEAERRAALAEANVPATPVIDTRDTFERVADEQGVPADFLRSLHNRGPVEFASSR